MLGGPPSTPGCLLQSWHVLFGKNTCFASHPRCPQCEGKQAALCARLCLRSQPHGSTAETLPALVGHLLSAKRFACHPVSSSSTPGCVLPNPQFTDRDTGSERSSSSKEVVEPTGAPLPAAHTADRGSGSSSVPQGP